MCAKRKPIPYAKPLGFDGFSKSLFLMDGTEIRFCPSKCRTGDLYVTKDGTGYLLDRRGKLRYRESHYNSYKNCKNKKNANRKQRYKNFGDGRIGLNVLVHRAVWIAWRGPIPKGWQVHHLNGKTTDNRLVNLIALSRERHRLFDNTLTAIRMTGQLYRMTPQQILELTERTTYQDPAARIEYEMTHHMEC